MNTSSRLAAWLSTVATLLYFTGEPENLTVYEMKNVLRQSGKIY